MITALATMNIIKISPVNVGPLIVAVTLSEKDLGGELKVKKRTVNLILSKYYLLIY